MWSPGEKLVALSLAIVRQGEDGDVPLLLSFPPEEST